jgi:hypothetical protein
MKRRFVASREAGPEGQILLLLLRTQYRHATEFLGRKRRRPSAAPAFLMIYWKNAAEIFGGWLRPRAS